MPYQKLKEEKYSNIGGVNQKASTYVTGDKEMLDIENYDFQVPGALNKRWGFTAAYAPSASFSIGSSQTINAIWQVTTPDYSGATVTAVNIMNLFGFDSGVAIVSGTLQGSTLVPWVTGATNSIWDHSEFIDSTYYSNAISSYKNKSGNTLAYKFGMIRGTVDGTISDQFGVWTVGISTTAGAAIPADRTYLYAYLDQQGFVGMPSGVAFPPPGTTYGSITITGFTLTPTRITGGASFNASAWGATAYVIFANKVPGFPSTDYISLAAIPAGATLFTDTGDYTKANQYFYYPLFPRQGVDDGFFAPALTVDQSNALSFVWNISEVFANRLWVDYSLNEIAFSELEDMENFLPGNSRIIASNNFRFVCFKAYNQSLIIICQKGVFRLTGDTPENFSVVEMSKEYGGISDKAVVIFNEKMWFLDYESIIQFNGSNFDNVGNRVDAYLNRMNRTAAYRKACALHFPERNEVWFSIPIDGSTVNNMTLVYDYLVDGWTTFRGDKLKATALAVLYSNFSALNYVPSVKEYFFGSIGASMYKFGESFTSDDGSGITLSYTTKFHNELGKSQTAQFRRFYQDIGSYTGPTLTFGLEFYANYSNTTISYTTSMVYNIWQKRIDFGIPASSLSVKVSHGSTQGRLQINGYTMEFRFQRAVTL